MTKYNNIKVGISIGDINGIGLEIVLKTFTDKRILTLCTPILYASKKTIATHKKILNINTTIQGISNSKAAIDGKINLVNVWDEDATIEIGKATEQGGKYALRSLESAVQDLKNNVIDVLVTAPINKNTIQSKDFKFPGHTEYLEANLDGESLMILMSGDLKVALLTGHIPIENVAKTITPVLITKKVKVLQDTLKQDFSINKPKIALLSINPHAGDDGVIGNDDEKVMIPTINKLQKDGFLVYGPYPADSFFGSGNYTNFDAILAAYHDQGLTPFKTLAFGKGVNYTAGLSHIRTSPDHGTAFDIAGKGKADESSFKEALYTAISIYKTRKQNLALEANAL